MRGNGNAQCQCGIPGTHLSVDRGRGAVPSFVARQPRSLGASLRGNAEMRSRSSTLRSTESRGCSAGPRTALLPQRRTSYTFYLPLDLRKPCAIPPFPMPHAPCPLPSPFPPFHLPPFLLVAACPMSHVPCPMSHAHVEFWPLPPSTSSLVSSSVFRRSGRIMPYQASPPPYNLTNTTWGYVALGGTAS